MFKIWRQPILEYYFPPGSLDEAIDALEADNKFLKQGSIFSDELLDQWIKVKREEVHSIGTMPHS